MATAIRVSARDCRRGLLQRACLALLALCLASAPRRATAEGSDPPFKPTTDRVDFFSYGRMGIGWTQTGQLAAGHYMNLGDRRAIGGRLEEGDYIEPGLRFHILRGERDTDTMVDLVLDFELWSNDGSILSDLANDWKLLTIVPEQAYIQAHNLFHVRGLDMWLGARLYRKNDIHINDYFYFNNLPSQGLGVMYKNLDTAVLVMTGSSPFYQTDLNQGTAAANTPEVVKRFRTIFVAQYKVPFWKRSTYVQGLGELHFVPRSRDAVHFAAPNVNPTDYGWVLGAKLHLDLGNDQFNDTSFRYGTRIANGAASGRSTFDTFGDPAMDGTYKGAYGIEVVDHFMWNVRNIFSLNGYATFHYDQGARDYVPMMMPPPPTSAAPSLAAVTINPDTRLDFAVGVRPVLYLWNQFHLMAEATYQGRKDQGRALGTALKLSVVPTFVPGGKRGDFWARPHIRLIYTFGYYNQAAVDQLLSPYLQTVGPTRFAHFIGARTEWWFY
jgi:maltoporin